MLGSRRGNHVRQATITNDSIAQQAHSARRSDDAAAPIAVDIAVRGDRHGRADGQVVGHDDVGRPGEMDAQNHDHGCGLWKVVKQFVANTNLHPTSPDFTVSWWPKYPSIAGCNSMRFDGHRGGGVSPEPAERDGANERVE